MYVTVSSNLTSVSILSPQAQKMICLFWCNGFLITRGNRYKNKKKIKRIHLSSSTLVISKLTVLIIILMILHKFTTTFMLLIVYETFR